MAEPSKPEGEGHQVQALAIQGLLNRVIRGLLCTPLISQAMGSRLVTLYVVGRKSGKRYSVPVAYTRHDGVLLVGSPFGWGRNLRTGEPLEIRLQGKRRLADVEVVADEAGVVEQYGIIAQDNQAFARFNKIGYDEHGKPVPADLHTAWSNGARVFRLKPR